MKYWRLYTSAEKEVGFVPQIVEAIFEGHYKDENQLWNKVFKKIDKNTIIPKGHLHKRARLTDLMSVSFGAGDLFTTDKLRNIVQKYSQLGVQFADSEIVTNKGEIIKTNIKHAYITDHSFLNIPQCEFCITNRGIDKLNETVKFNTYEEFVVKKNALILENKMYDDKSLLDKSISISKIAFNDSSNFGICSVFDISYGGHGFFVSQLLKDEILNEKCTGVIFREINERYP
jgi:hypothetical protein